MQLRCLSKCKVFIFFSFQSFTQQWGHNIPWGSWANQLQPIDYYLGKVHLLLNINSQAVFGVVNSTDGSWLTTVYVSTESWTWVSFIKLANTYIALGFQDATKSYVKITNYGSKFSTYVLLSGFKLFAFTKTTPYPSV